MNDRRNRLPPDRCIVGVDQSRAMPIVLRRELYELVGLVRAAVFASGQWQKVGGNSFIEYSLADLPQL